MDKLGGLQPAHVDPGCLLDTQETFAHLHQRSTDCFGSWETLPKKQFIRTSFSVPPQRFVLTSVQVSEQER